MPSGCVSVPAAFALAEAIAFVLTVLLPEATVAEYCAPVGVLA